MIQLFFSFLISFGFLMIAMTVHEFSHALVAYKLGDTTAKFSGRLTLNPFAHIDPVWTFLFPLFLFISTQGQFIFGAAKPVPINFRALRNPRRDVIWVGLSGPLANFILAFLASILLRIMPAYLKMNLVFYTLIMINIVLGVFNLIPIPPLDGSRILMGLLPRGLSSKYSSIEPYGFVILILLIFMGFLDYIIWPVVRLILSWLITPF